MLYIPSHFASCRTEGGLFYNKFLYLYFIRVIGHSLHALLTFIAHWKKYSMCVDLVEHLMHFQYVLLPKCTAKMCYILKSNVFNFLKRNIVCFKNLLAFKCELQSIKIRKTYCFVIEHANMYYIINTILQPRKMLPNY